MEDFGIFYSFEATAEHILANIPLAKKRKNYPQKWIKADKY